MRSGAIARISKEEWSLKQLPMLFATTPLDALHGTHANWRALIASHFIKRSPDAMYCNSMRWKIDTSNASD